jgi:CRISPR-associated endonuclease/helicase Cas3
MNELHAEQFEEFFRALYGKPPFPWQRRLANQVCAGKWPTAIALPTASGKTACIDIAIFALACQATWPVAQHVAPRRVFFVVDRRVIVDEAYERARNLAHEQYQAEGGILK